MVSGVSLLPPAMRRPAPTAAALPALPPSPPWPRAAWTPVGGPVSVGAATYINLRFWRYQQASAAYLAYSDAGLGGAAVVKKWA